MMNLIVIYFNKSNKNNPKSWRKDEITENIVDIVMERRNDDYGNVYLLYDFS